MKTIHITSQDELPQVAGAIIGSLGRRTVVACRGEMGAGKTTLVNLLMRFYDAWGGEILIDGKAVSSYTRDSLRGAFTMVLQDTWLFDGTVFENIAYGRPGATLDDVRRVARAANVADYIESLPDGYCSTVEDGGFNLSKLSLIHI